MQEPAKQEKGKHLFSVSQKGERRFIAQVVGKAFTSGWCSTEQVTRRMLQPGLIKQILRHSTGGGDPTVCHRGGLSDLLRCHPPPFLHCCN